VTELFKPLAIIINICVLVKDNPDVQRSILYLMRNLYEVIPEEL